MSTFLKWLASLGLLGLLLLVLLIIAATAHFDRGPSAGVLRVVLDGSIPEAPPSEFMHMVGGAQQVSLLRLSTAIRRAARDKDILGLVLDIKAPEVGLAVAQELEEAMAVFRKSGKWNAAYLDTVGEITAGTLPYALAVSADNIVVGPVGDVNLAPPQAHVPFLRGTFDKLDIEPYFDKRQDYKTAANMFTHTEFTEAHKASVKSLMDDLQDQLITHIAQRRDKDAAEVRQWFVDGNIAGADAVHRGLIDELAYRDVFAERAREVAKGEEDFWVDVGDYARDDPDTSGDATFGVIFVDGMIMRGGDDGDDGGSTAGAAVIAQAFRSAREAKVQGILLRISSPGGSYVASDIIRREVARTRKAHIPVVVSMGHVAASGGYFIAMDGDEIVADGATLTGSIGVYAGFFATRRFLRDVLGVSFGEYNPMPEAEPLSFLDPPSDRVRQRLASTLDRVYDDFVGKAAKSRNMSEDAMHAAAQGRVWSGNQALALGLVDKVGGVGVALAALATRAGLEPTTQPHLRVFPKPPGLFATLRHLLAFETRAVGGVRRMMALWQQAGLGKSAAALTMQPLQIGW